MNYIVAKGDGWELRDDSAESNAMLCTLGVEVPLTSEQRDRIITAWRPDTTAELGFRITERAT